MPSAAAPPYGGRDVVPAGVMGFDGECVQVRCQPFWCGPFLAWPHQMRRPFDFAADEAGEAPKLLTVSAGSAEQRHGPPLSAYPCDWMFK